VLNSLFLISSGRHQQITSTPVSDSAIPLAWAGVRADPEQDQRPHCDEQRSGDCRSSVFSACMLRVPNFAGC